MADKPSFFQQAYDAFRRRTRLFTRSGSGAFTELTSIAFLTTKVVTNAQGAAVLDMSGMGFVEVLDVQLQAVCPTKDAVNKIDCMLVGVPSLTTVTVQTYKPALAVLGALALQVAASTTVYVTVRGRVAA